MTLLRIMYYIFLVFVFVILLYFLEKQYTYYKFYNWYNENKYNIYNNNNINSLYKNWNYNEILIYTMNKKNKLFKLSHNQFSILNQLDINNIYKFKINPPNIQFDKTYRFMSLRPNIDWLKYNAVTSVKNQYNCQSCWAFAAAAAIESAYYIKHKVLFNFSVQQILDCNNHNFGCNGGFVTTAYDNLKYGLCYSIDYPYINYTKLCYTYCHKNLYSSVIGYNIIEFGSDYKLIYSLLQQPIVVHIHASDIIFHLYKSGIYDYDCKGELDHAILLVGYDKNYYKLKNSWGIHWGESGYIRLIRDVEIEYGQCEILRYALYPILI